MKPGVKLALSLSAVLLIQPTFIPRVCGSDCYTDCIIRYGCDTSHPYAGTSCYDLCRDGCKNEAWGSIAYSWKEKISGWSWAQYYEGDARRTAREACTKAGGANCIVQTAFYDTCGAVAADGDLVAWGTDATKVKAGQRALLECAKIGGKKCVVQTSLCSNKNASASNPTSPPPAPKVIAWGAIAYSTKDMGAGWAQGKGDRASAEQEAMSVCSQRGKACVLQTAFNKACGALAADRDFAGSGTSTDPRDAQQKALAACQKAGGTRCALHISFCSF
jgi:hypothetical protein